MKARGIRRGAATARAVASQRPISFLGGVDAGTSRILDPESDARGEAIAGRVFSFPYGKGSTVGSYALYGLKLSKLAPAAIVNETAEPIVATGAIISDIPMVDGVDVSLFRTGDVIRVDADSGTTDIVNVREKHVVTCIVRRKGRILLLERSDRVGSYRGQWAGVSGFIEEGESDDNAARREMDEEARLGEARLAKRAPPMRFRDGELIWTVHPFLFEAKSLKVRIDWEHKAYKWVLPKEVCEYKTVPGLEQVISRLLQ
jgi:predicted aconitase with swiveling domain